MVDKKYHTSSHELLQISPKMAPNFSPASAVFLIFMLVSVPRAVCQDDAQFQSCSREYDCGNMNIVYPFWGGDRQEACGHPGFELTCDGDAPEFAMEGARYRVLHINTSSNTVTVSRADYWDNNCPAEKVNTNLDTALFSYNTTYPNVTIYYECSTLYSVPNEFNCSGDTFSYYVTGTSDLSTIAGSSILTCKENVVVPIFQSAESAIMSGGYTVPLLTEALKGGFGLEWSARNAECKGCAESGGQCGYQSNQFACYCRNGTSVSTCQTATISPPPGSSTVPRRIAIGVSTAVAVVLIVTLAMLFGLRRKWSSGAKFNLKKKSKDDKKLEEFLRRHGSLAPKRYTYWAIKKMTNSFTCKLGQGGFGSVYKGKLSDDRLVAVKVLSELKGNGEEFMNEIASIGRTSHVNVVMLLGFCHEGAKRALIYEFMPNGSLDKFISEADFHLECDTLYRIAVGIGRGLEYLHRGCNTRILHFDIKPHNILLDEDFCPKISDFGLAKLCQRKESLVSMTHARGTIGYIAPEVFCKNFGGVSHKSDVYSYGMLVLDLVGGRKNKGATRTSEKYFPDWIYKHLEQNGDDLILGRVLSEEEEETVRKMILVSLWCIQTNPKERPSIEKVVEMLGGSLQAIETPPKPFLFSPPSSPHQSSATSLSVPST